jgi:ethanolamine ammonia-lyase small subunit
LASHFSHFWPFDYFHSQHKGGDDGKQLAVPEGWVAVPGAIIVREKHHKKYNTRDEIDERLETEEVHHLGNVTNQVHTFSFIGPNSLSAPSITFSR